MDKTLCIHAIISGKVQGVFYRHGTRLKAQELGLTGWVKNLDNGNVELTACGNPESIHHLITWLHQGPPRAKVNDVQWKEIDIQNFDNFKIT